MGILLNKLQLVEVLYTSGCFISIEPGVEISSPHK